jgi:hypothetical protein
MSHSTSGSSSAGSTGQVLGATAPAVLGATAPAVLGATGAAFLPVTGNNPFLMAFVIITISVAALVLISFVASRIFRKFIR